MNQKAYDVLAFIHKLRTDCVGCALQLVRYRASMSLVETLQISGDGDSE